MRVERKNSHVAVRFLNEGLHEEPNILHKSRRYSIKSRETEQLDCCAVLKENDSMESGK